MTSPQPSGKSGDTMSAMEAIFQQHSVRHFAPSAMEETVVRELLDACAHAPTVMNEEPWAFLVVQDESVLNRLSESVKESLRAEARGFDPDVARQLIDLVNRPDFRVFHHARTLIVILGWAQGPFVTADCWLAAENLMLAAFAKGLGACVIGQAVEALDTPEWRAELKIPNGFVAIAPVVVGVPAGETSSAPRQNPGMVMWR